MYKEHTISLVIPCLNEEKGLERTIKKIPGFVDEILVVDNGSTDDTANIARRLGAKVIFEERC